MNARDNNLSIADAFLDNNRGGFAGPNTFTVMFRKNTIAFDSCRIIIINDGSGGGTGSKCNFPWMTVMSVHDAEGQPVICIRLVSSSTEYQKVSTVLNKPPDAR